MPLVIELAVVVCILTSLKQTELLSRLVMVCTIANLLTLPAVWVLSLAGFYLARLWAGLVLLLIFEAMAILVEGSAYAWIGRLGWRAAFIAAILANAASFLTGIIVSQAFPA